MPIRKLKPSPLRVNELAKKDWVSDQHFFGSNDAEGGPPDPNDFVSSSNLNSRADRSNLIFLGSMAENTPMDYISYTAYTSDTADTLDPLQGPGTYDTKVADMKEQLRNATPCPVSSPNCFEQVMRLAYLNQQSDLGSLGLRRGRPCLTQKELDEIQNEQERQNHPLNCAKMNAKPYPYFDAGVMKAEVPGKHSFFGSRNNNFSNRDQTGIVCVRGTTMSGLTENCSLDPATHVLQDTNVALGNTMQQRSTVQDASTSACIDSANSGAKGTANDQGASSCITATTGTNGDTLTEETFTTEQSANDAMGDGDMHSCEEIEFFYKPKRDETPYLWLAILLAFVGFGAAWASVCCYNRIRAQRAAMKETGFQGNTQWKKVAGDAQVI